MVNLTSHPKDRKHTGVCSCSFNLTCRCQESSRCKDEKCSLTGMREERNPQRAKGSRAGNEAGLT